MKLQVKTDNSNYTAKVVKLSAPRPHPNAQKLQLVTIDSQVVITGLDAKENDVYIYFPLESSINSDYLSWSNSFSSADLNADKTKKGFFPSSGRVKAVKLRGTPSEGYIVPVADLAKWLKADLDEFVVGTEFSHYGDILICEKYVNKEAIRRAQELARRESKKGKKVKRESRLVEGQFRIAEDTENLKRNIHKISPNDIVSISYKMHGCNASIGKVLVKKKLSIIEKIAKLFGANINTSQYDLVYASRRVIKNQYADQKTMDYYDTDVWGDVAKRYGSFIKDGVTCHGEIVGFTATGKEIQNGYHYGQEVGKADFYVYRMFYTSPNGEVFEFTMPQIQRYCAKNGLNVVPVFYYGKAKDLYPQISIDDHWHENFINELIKNYTEKDCFMCKDKVVPEEGIVLAKEGDYFESYKLKSIKFLERETSLLDKGEVSIEDVESAKLIE